MSGIFKSHKMLRLAALAVLGLGVFFVAAQTAFAGNPFYPTALVYYDNAGVKAQGDATTPNSYATAFAWRSNYDAQFDESNGPTAHHIYAADPIEDLPAFTSWDVGSTVWTNPAAVGDTAMIAIVTYDGLNGWTGDTWIGGAKRVLPIQDVGDATAWYRDVVMEPIPAPALQTSSTTSLTINWQGLWDNTTGASGGTGPESIVGYSIYRSVDGGAYSYLANVAQTPGGTLAYTDNAVSQNTNYTYKLGVRFEWTAHTPNYYEPSALGPASATLTPTPPEPIMMKFISVPPAMPAGTNSAVQTIQASDAAGNATNTLSDTTVALTTNSTGANARFYSVSGGVCTTTIITSVTILTGTNTAQFCYYDEKAGSWTLTADKSDPASPDWAAGTQPVTVSSGTVLGSIDLILNSAQKNRIAFAGTNTLTALDTFGNTMTTFSAASNNVTFTVAPGAASVAGLGGAGSAQLTLGGDFAGGIANLTNRLQLAGQSGSYTVTATTADGKQDTAPVTLGGGALHHFNFDFASPQRIDTAFTGVNTITAKDIDDNTVTDFNASTTNVTVAESAAAGTVSGLGSGSNNILNQSGSFVNGVASVAGAMKYVGTAASHAFRATAGSVNSISGAVDFTVGPFSKFGVSLNTPQANAQAFSTAVVTAQDAGNNTVTDFDASGDAVTVTVNSGSVSNNILNQSGSFVNGVASLAGQLTYTGQVGGRTFTATSASGKTGAANATITAGTRTLVKIVNGNTSAATEIGASTLTADQTLPLYAAGYDVSNNWTGLVNGTWSSSGTLAPAVNASSANTVTFAPAAAPTSGVISFTDGVLNDDTGTVTVNPGTVNRLLVSAPATATAGQQFLVTITAVDADGNTVTGYGGSQTVSFSGPGTAPDSTTPTYPTNVTFTNGVGTAAVTLVKSETVKLTVTRDTLSGQSGDIIVSGAAANAFTVSAPATATAGQQFAAVITAYDDFGNVDLDYDGQHTLVFENPGVAPDSTAPAYPAAVTFTNGVGSADSTLYKKETTTLKVTEGAKTGTSATILVGAAAADRIVKVSGDSQTGPVAQALPLPLVVQVFDAYDNPKDSYSVGFVVTAGGGSVNVPAVATADDGTAQITWTMGSSPGENNNTLEARASGITGSPVAFTASANGNGFIITIPEGVVAGTPFIPSIRLVDSEGATVTTYNGTKTVVFTGPANGPDGTAPTYPVTIAFVNGEPQTPVQITLVAAETTTLTMTEGSLSGTSASFTVKVGPGARMAFTSPPQQIALNTASQPVTVCVQDQYGNAVISLTDRQLNLAATSPGGLFSESSDGPWDSYQATLGTGLSCTTVYYKDSYAGSRTMSVASAGLSEATQQISIVPVTAPAPDTDPDPAPVTGADPSPAAAEPTVINRETTRTIYVYTEKPTQQSSTSVGSTEVTAVPIPTSVFPVIKTPRSNSLIAPLDGTILVSGTAQPGRTLRLKTDQGQVLGSATSDVSGLWSMFINRDRIPGNQVSIFAERTDSRTRSASVGFTIKQRTFMERVILFITP